MLMTRAGSFGSAAARSAGSSAIVRSNTPCTFVRRTFSHPLGGNSSSGAPHPAPALLTRMSSSSKRSLVARASSAAPSGVEMSPGIAWQSPICASAAAAALTSSALREETITRAPACTRPRAIISPIPREPPVTSAVLGETSNRALIAARAYRSPRQAIARSVRLDEIDVAGENLDLAAMDEVGDLHAVACREDERALAQILGQPLPALHDPLGVPATRREVSAGFCPKPAHEVPTGRANGGVTGARVRGADREVPALERREHAAVAALRQHEPAVEEPSHPQAPAGGGRGDANLTVVSFDHRAERDLPGGGQRHEAGCPGYADLHPAGYEGDVCGGLEDRPREFPARRCLPGARVGM